MNNLLRSSMYCIRISSLRLLYNYCITTNRKAPILTLENRPKRLAGFRLNFFRTPLLEEVSADEQQERWQDAQFEHPAVISHENQAHRQK